MRAAPGRPGAEQVDGPAAGLRVLVVPRPPSTRLVLAGDLDLASAATLDAALARVERSPWTRYEVDLEAVAFADCTGTRPLLGLARRAAARGGELVLWGPSPRVALVLAHVGLLGRAAPPQPVSRPAGDLPAPRSAG